MKTFHFLSHCSRAKNAKGGTCSYLGECHRRSRSKGASVHSMRMCVGGIAMHHTMRLRLVVLDGSAMM